MLAEDKVQRLHRVANDNKFLKEKDDKVHIRVMPSSDKYAKVMQGMRSRFVRNGIENEG